jgi:hypothetical protein
VYVRASVIVKNPPNCFSQENAQFDNQVILNRDPKQEAAYFYLRFSELISGDLR